MYPRQPSRISTGEKAMVSIQEFDLPARWTSLIQDNFSEAVHNLAHMWPDEQSMTISYRVIEGYDHEFAQDLLANPDLHFSAANRALHQFLLDAGHGTILPLFELSISLATKFAQCLN